MSEVGVHPEPVTLLDAPLAEVRERVGALEQVVRIEQTVDVNGPGHGTRRIRLVNGGGLEVDVLPDRAMDLGALTVGGVGFAWRSAVGPTAPAAAEATGRGWLRTFGGGMLTTCGLDTFGPPSTDDGDELPMHGRVSAVPATVTLAEVTTEELVVEGTVRQAAVFGEDLLLRRRISSPIGSTRVRIDDTVTNESDRHQPHMLLYHVNLGWPLLDDRTTIEIGQETAEPRDHDAERGFDERGRFGAPQPHFREQVFIHTTNRPEQRVATVTNPDRGLQLVMRYADTLPAIFEWKMPASRFYALGLEPANTPEMGGRAAARTNDRLPMLAPGESCAYWIEIEVTS